VAVTGKLARVLVLPVSLSSGEKVTDGRRTALGLLATTRLEGQ